MKVNSRAPVFKLFKGIAGAFANLFSSDKT